VIEKHLSSRNWGLSFISVLDQLTNIKMRTIVLYHKRIVHPNMYI